VPAREPLRKIREAIRSAAPAEATEVISYGIPAFKHNKMLVWYAAFSDHCSLFPTASVIAAFKDRAEGVLHRQRANRWNLLCRS
jgi:uncharacterized protein YdhG (YjbR/CyaY superfamily)